MEVSLKTGFGCGFLYELTYTIFYVMHSDSARYQVYILPLIGIGMIIKELIKEGRKNDQKE